MNIKDERQRRLDAYRQEQADENARATLEHRKPRLVPLPATLITKGLGSLLPVLPVLAGLLVGCAILLGVLQ